MALENCSPCRPPRRPGKQVDRVVDSAVNIIHSLPHGFEVVKDTSKNDCRREYTHKVVLTRRQSRPIPRLDFDPRHCPAQQDQRPEPENSRKRDSNEARPCWPRVFLVEQIYCHSYQMKPLRALSPRRPFTSGHRHLTDPGLSRLRRNRLSARFASASYSNARVLVFGLTAAGSRQERSPSLQSVRADIIQSVSADSP